MHQPDEGFKLTRREMLLTSATSVAVTLAPSAAAVADKAMAPSPRNAPVNPKVSLPVNGKQHALELDTRTTLLYALRTHPPLPAPT